MDETDEQIVRDFTGLYYRERVDWGTHYRGYPCVKTPTDLWSIQEIIYETHPTLIIELGTFAGGSALFYADMQSSYMSGKVGVVTIDNADPPKEALRQDIPWPPEHDSLVFLRGSSIDVKLVSYVTRMYEAGLRRTMILLDSQHESAHVQRELELWAGFVTPGCYLVVEDTAINGHPLTYYDAGHAGLAHTLQTIEETGGGPMEGLKAWLPYQPRGRWTTDRSRERHLLTYNPEGYLRREG